MPMVLLEVLLYLGIITLTRLARPSFSKLCYRRFEPKNVLLYHTSLKFLAITSIIAAYIFPFIIIPHTIHPVIGWSLYLLGSFSFCSIAINAFLLPTLAVLTPCIGTFGVLLVMAFPWYKDGVARALAVFAYAFCASPILWVTYSKVVATLQVSIEREAFLPSRLSDSPPVSGFNKLYWLNSGSDFGYVIGHVWIGKCRESVGIRIIRGQCICFLYKLHSYQLIAYYWYWSTLTCNFLSRWLLILCQGIDSIKNLSWYLRLQNMLYSLTQGIIKTY